MAPELPGKVGDPGASASDNRLFVEAVLWIARTGAPWRDLPHEFGKWYSVYTRFWRWAQKGVWERVFKALSDDPDSNTSSSTQPTSGSISMAPAQRGIKSGHRQVARRPDDEDCSARRRARQSGALVLLPGQRHDTPVLMSMAGVAWLSSATRHDAGWLRERCTAQAAGCTRCAREPMDTPRRRGKIPVAHLIETSRTRRSGASHALRKDRYLLRGETTSCRVRTR